MSPQTFKSRVSVGAGVLMLGTIGYLVHYTWRSFYRAYRFSFGEPEIWQNHWRVEEAAVIEFSTRVAYFALWIGVVLLSIGATLVAIYLLNRLRKGHIFDLRNSKALRWVGAFFVIAMVADTVFASVDAYMITRHNLVNVEPIKFLFDPSDMKVMVLGIVILMFGWVMRDAIDVDKTNKEFV